MEKSITPNLIIIGAPKCGTTSLFNWLSSHDDVLASSVKETRFYLNNSELSFNRECNYASGDMQGYYNYFSGYNGERIVLEATPEYLYDPEIATAIKSINSDTKIIVILRKPSDRIVSLYRFLKYNIGILDKNLSFKEFYNNYKIGKKNYFNGKEVPCPFLRTRYSKYLPVWKEEFGNNLKIIKFDEMKANPVAVLDDISQFLGISTDFWVNYDFKSFNESYMPNNRSLHAILKKIYKSKYFKVDLTKLKRFYLDKFTIKNPLSENIPDYLISELNKDFEDEVLKLEKEFFLDLKDWL